ncbi:hypothetical protein BST61_g4290 [Cercospora zeina]
MEVEVENEDESEYRLLFDKHVKYLKIAPATFEQDILSFPVDSLPPLPFSDPSWKAAHISRQPGSERVDVSFSHRNLAAVQNVWHPTRVNVLDLERVEQLTAAAFEAVLPTSAIPSSASLPQNPSQKTVVIAKIARFEWEIPRIERETRAYQVMQQEQEASSLAPRFLGHLHEHGRIMGFILEKIDGRQHASLEHREACEMALAKLHKFGLHGDVNRYNFLVGNNGEITLLDFERFDEDATADMRAKEVQSLRAELTDESGRGGGFMFRESVD